MVNHAVGILVGRLERRQLYQKSKPFGHINDRYKCESLKWFLERVEAKI